MPSTMISDNGKTFKSKELKEFWRRKELSGYILLNFPHGGEGFTNVWFGQLREMCKEGFANCPVDVRGTSYAVDPNRRRNEFSPLDVLI